MITGYYHIAALGHWREVVAEQLRVLSRVHRGPLKVGLQVPQWEEGYVIGALQSLGFDYEVIFQSAENRFEFPTLERLEADCRAGLAGHVFYLHTKGVTGELNWKRQQWRWLMNYVLCNDIASLPDKDIAAAIWWDIEHPNYPFAAGNFWLAKADYIRRLPRLDVFRQTYVRDLSAPHWGGDKERFAAELWSGQGKPSVSCRMHNADNHSDAFWSNRPELVNAMLDFHLHS